MKYETVIGLEVHVQLSTESKIFCGCSTKFGATPNSQTCPVCLGLPGVLPVFNEEVLNLAIKVALALNCKISKIMKFDRKNYYYPDLPKNFQISQFDKPLSSNGYLEIETQKNPRKIAIKRVHLEEDAGKLIHEQTGNASLVDLNRTGTPLLEVVSEPEITSPQEAQQYLLGLRAVLQYLDVSDCNMEEGSLRCDANISMRPQGAEELGVKAEIKNMNTFKGVKAALEYEERRQVSLLENGEKIIQETRLWNGQKQKTFSMRSKEEAHDYRYFPEPDLVPFEIKKERIEDLRATLPELPNSRKQRFQESYQLTEYDTSVLVSNKEMADYFEKCAQLFKKPKAIANWITQDIAAELNVKNIGIRQLGITPENLVKMVEMIESGMLSTKIAKEVVKLMIETGKDPKKIVEEKGLIQVSSDEEIRKVAKQVIIENKKSVDDYRKGKKKSIAHLMGQVMKKTEGRANPKLLNQILEEELKEAE